MGLNNNILLTASSSGLLSEKTDAGRGKPDQLHSGDGKHGVILV